MLFLLVHATTGSEAEARVFLTFERILKESFRVYEDTAFPHSFDTRTVDQVSDLIFEMDDTELSQTDLIARSKAYDRIDAVFMFGSARMGDSLPWDHRVVNLQTLIRNCIQTKKPVLCIGFCAAMFAYCLAAISAFSHVMNADADCTAIVPEDLAAHTTYYESNRRVWVHAITGEVYGFDAGIMSWRSIGSIGMSHCIDSNNNSEEESIECRVLAPSSPLLKKVPSTFSVRCGGSGWHLHSHSPMTSLGFFVVAEESRSGSPIVMVKDECLLVNMPILYDEPINPVLQRMCRNYVRMLCEKLITYDKTKSSLAQLLYGCGIASDLKARSSILTPSAFPHTTIPTRIRGGPRRVIPAHGLIGKPSSGGLFKAKILRDSDRFPVLRTEGGAFPSKLTLQHRFQDPRHSRAKRLHAFLASEDYSFSLPAMHVSDEQMSEVRSVGGGSISFAEDVRSNWTVSNDGGGGVEERGAIRGTKIVEESTLDDASSEEVSDARPDNGLLSSLLSRGAGEFVSNARPRRPVSASVLLGRLPLQYPVSSSIQTEQSMRTKVLRPASCRPYSSYRKFLHWTEPDVGVAVPPRLPESDTRIVSPMFLKYFSGTSDLIARPPMSWGAAAKPRPEEDIHNNTAPTLYGPWRRY